VKTAALEDTIEQLREQLIDTLERARTSEARALHAEQRAQLAESQPQESLPSDQDALDQLREQLVDALERAQASEARAQLAERRPRVESRPPVAQTDDRAALEHLREQLADALERAQYGEARAAEAERQVQLVAAQPARNAHVGPRLTEADDHPQAANARGGSGAIWLSVALGFVLACAGGTYAVLYRPLQQRSAAQQESLRGATERHAQEVSALQTRNATERQQFESQRQELESQLTAAREATPTATVSVVGPGAQAADAASVRSRWHRAKDAAADGAADGSDQGAKHRWQRAKSSTDGSDSVDSTDAAHKPHRWQRVKNTGDDSDNSAAGDSSKHLQQHAKSDDSAGGDAAEGGSKHRAAHKHGADASKESGASAPNGAAAAPSKPAAAKDDDNSSNDPLDGL
jgi:hypothetical protein